MTLKSTSLDQVLTRKHFQEALRIATEAAREAGSLMRANRRKVKKINSEDQRDIKLELDVQCQKIIENRLANFPLPIPTLGEEGNRGDMAASHRWVIDPIDGTVNFAYGIPHACVSIALQSHRDYTPEALIPPKTPRSSPYITCLGVVYDPFCDEMWTAIRGQGALLNGKKIQVSQRSRLDESILSLGFSKTKEKLDLLLPVFNQIVYKVRKVRIMGAAALAIVYVADGRFEAFVESGVRLWDIAAAGLILECAGGEFWNEPLSDSFESYRIIANNGKMRRHLKPLLV